MDIIVDVHSHFYPKAFAQKLQEIGTLNLQGNTAILTWEGRKSAAGIGIVNIEAKLKEIKRMDNHVYSILSVPNPWTYFIRDKKEEIEIAKKCNEEISSIMRSYPSYFGGFATLPLNDIEASMEEAERAIKELNLQGFVIGTGINSSTIADDKYKELLDLISRLGKPILLHPGTLKTEENEGVLSVIASFPFETTYVILKMIKNWRDGIKIIAPHGGGFIPYQLGRVNLLKEIFNYTEDKPWNIIKKGVYFDSVLYREEELSFLVESVGKERVLFGTDHPFTVSNPSLMMNNVNKMDREIQDYIMFKNALEIIKIHL